MALSLKELYKISLAQVKDVLPQESADFRLEEATLDQEAGKWELVVSYLARNINQPEQTLIWSSSTLNLPYERVYKRILIDERGTFLGFQMYKDQ